MTDTERQELHTLMQQWGRNDEILYQKVREWVEAKIAALKAERDALLAEAQERGVRLSAEFLDREADANFMPNEPAKLLLHGMASALRLNLLATARKQLEEKS